MSKQRKTENFTLRRTRYRKICNTSFFSARAKRSFAGGAACNAAGILGGAPNDTASYARVYQHDVRAKQTKVCDAERAGFQTPTHSSNYLKTDKQLIVQGRVAFSTPSLAASLAAFPRPSMDKNGQKCTSNLQMPVFAITDDRKALRSIFRIFIPVCIRVPVCFPWIHLAKKLNGHRHPEIFLHWNTADRYSVFLLD